MFISKSTNKIANIFLSIALALTIVLGTIFIQPVFADSVTIPYWDGQYYTTNNNVSVSYVVENGAVFATDATNSRFLVYQYPAYSFRTPAGDSSYVVLVSELGYPRLIRSYNSGNDVQYVSRFTSYHDEDLGFYYTVTSDPYGPLDDSNFPAFSSVEEGLQAVRNYIDNGSVVDFQKTIYLEPGYAIYILTNGGTMELTTQFSVYSNIFNGGWGNSVTQRIGTSSTRVPPSGYVFGAETGSIIPWTKLTTADSNFLGQTKYAHYLMTDLPSDGTYTVIYNPVYSYDDGVTSNVNSTITIEVSNFVGANIFALKSRLAMNGVVESTSPDDYQTYKTTGTGDYVIGDGDTLYWYDVDNGEQSEDGSPTNFEEAPYNDTSSIPDNGTTIGSLLEKIIAFFQAPVEHIKNLYNAGINFFNYLSMLWAWIPAEITGVLISAVIVLLVIGVIKFLWK